MEDNGYYFIEADQSQAEARVVAQLAEDWDLLRQMDTIDIHRMGASWIYEVVGQKVEWHQISKEDPMRFLGKTNRHAGAYGEGKRKLMLSVNSDARKFGIKRADGNILSITEKFAGQMLDKFHSKSPKIRGVFHRRVEDALRNSNRILYNPFGRRRQFFDRWENLLTEAYAQIPQSTVGDQTKFAGVRIRKRDRSIRLVLESHDALVAIEHEHKLERTARIMKEELEKPIDFSNCSLEGPELIIPCELKIGKNYKDLKDYHI